MERKGDQVAAAVLWVDRFGNAQLNVGADDIDDLGEVVSLTLPGGARRARRVATYGAIPPGEVGLVVDSYGLVSVCLDRQSAADTLALGSGDELTLEPGDDRPSPIGVTMRARR
jgi:S-adenosylmethionine hydrolase